MEAQIRNVAVLGAGVMGSRLAALCVGHGLEVLLLDQPSNERRRNELAERGLQATLHGRPASFYLPVDATRIRLGNFDDDLPAVRSVDWVIEAIVENLEAKHSLLARVAPLLSERAFLSSNTSGIPLQALAAGLPDGIRQRFFGTHFFNPPRYMRLVEIIPTPDSDRKALANLSDFIERRLGKDVVVARDTPNFIANRIGTFALLTTLRLMRAMALSVEEVDALTGPLLGWPKSATLRTLDLVGLDTLAHVVRNTHAMLDSDEHRDLYIVPDYIEEMIHRGWMGEKAGQGFYKRVRGGDDESQILALDLDHWEYRPRKHVQFSSADLAATMPTPSERLRYLTQSKDAAGQFLWHCLRDLLLYCAARVPEIAPSACEIDRAMRWGYNWEWGPFEIWDALGVQPTTDRMEAEGYQVPAYVRRMLEQRQPTFYRWLERPTTGDGKRANEAHEEVFTASICAYAPVPPISGAIELRALRQANREVRRMPGCSLLDLGEGVGCFEFHGKLNVIGGDTIRLVTESLADMSLPFEAFVIGNEAGTFSAGADLLYVLLSIQNDDWDAIGQAVDAFQAMTTAIKRSSRPVVAAPAGLALGGGCEIVLHAARVVAHSELYLGLVETGVGLIPAGGGCRQMACRTVQLCRRFGTATGLPGVEPLSAYKMLFEAIALGKVSTSAAHARELGYLRDGDTVVANRHRQLLAAREQARQLVQEGYAPPPAEFIPAPGPDIVSALELGIYLMHEAEYISDFDRTIALRLLDVIGAGRAPAGTAVAEEQYLMREREAFLSLCGEAKTQQRIQHMLQTGKPLRN